MKRVSLKIASVVFAAATGVGFSSMGGTELCEGFLPENTMKIPVGWDAPIGAKGSLSEAEFNKVLDRIERLYAPEIKKHGGTLKVNRKWSDPTVNASAQQSGSTWIINMFGGLARHKEITEEGFALVACHEIGHHIGGAPKISGWWGNDWATNEGGSDYFATLKCLRNYFAEDDNGAILEKATLDPFAVSKCEANFTNENDQLLCKRNSLAGDSVAGLFMDLRKETKRPKYDTPDTKVVTKMDDNHPATQCRMDTYFAGSICGVDVNIPQSNTDYREGSCVKETHTDGARPLCWFFPGQKQETPKPAPVPVPAHTVMY